jgi:multidrug efflux system membrane fusion protein
MLRLRSGACMKKYLRIAIPVLVGLLALGLIAYRIHTAAEGRGKKPPQGPTPVRTVIAERTDLPLMLDALGTVTSLATVTVRSQVAGQIVQIGFREGQDVKKGDLLAQIDPRPFQAALDQAEGQLARDEAALNNAKIDLARYEKLIEEDSVSRQQLDTQRSTVNQAQATLKTDQAQISAAKVNLSFARITSPVDGRVGLRKVDVGNYITAGDATGIVVITQLHPISVVFPVPEDGLAAVSKRFRAGAQIAVTVYDRSGDNALAAGKLVTIDNVVDTSTGTVKMRAMFENEDEGLTPNQFVNVRVLVDTLANAVTMPTAGIQRGADGTFVYVIDGDTAHAKPVKLGPAFEGKIAVVQGLDGGEQVAIEGTDRLKEGAKVITQEAPKSEAPKNPSATDDGATADRRQPRAASPVQ